MSVVVIRVSSFVINVVKNIIKFYINMAPNFSKITSRTDVKIGLAASAALGAWLLKKSISSR